jgi:hypothetical protein
LIPLITKERRNKMAISTKDYNEIAKRLAAVRPLNPNHSDIDHTNPAQLNYQKGAYAYWNQACTAIASYFTDTNPRFDRRQFLEACND